MILLQLRQPSPPFQKFSSVNAGNGLRVTWAHILESVFYHSGFDARCHAFTGLPLQGIDDGG
jgi:hypothetical protein